MNKSTFDYLCGELAPIIQQQTTHLRNPIDVDKRVAITLWRLATNVDYRTLAQLFGIGRSSACTVTLDTCRAIQKLMPKYVHIPTGEGMKRNVEGFSARWGFPQAAGAIDGTHIPILRPKGDSGADYYNRKGFYSIVMQAVVDFRGYFMDIYLGWPGKVHDARIFANSTFYHKGQTGTLLPDWQRQLSGVEVPLVILGDPAYPVLPWLMKAYPEHSGMSAQQKLFNYRLSRARMVVENAFGRLKGRWRCLLKRNDSLLPNVILITTACVVLHNICETFRDDCLEEWTVTDDNTLSIPATTGQSTSSASNVIRDAIASYIHSNQ